MIKIAQKYIQTTK